jgi:predicted MFS family arabinose efflux permease
MSQHHRGSLLSRLSAVSGFATLVTSSRDAKLMCLQRFVRLYAYGASFIILIQFLSSVGNISDAQIGLFLTLTMLGDALISLCLTIVTDRVRRRNVLAFGATSMAFSGVVFASSSSYWILVFASIVGVISPRCVMNASLSC